jgi:hypothetical protein
VPSDILIGCPSNIENEELVDITQGATEIPDKIEDGKYEYLLEKVNAVMPDVLAYKSIVRSSETEKGVIINFRDLLKTNCCLCNRTHEDNQFYLLYTEGKLFIKCKKSDQSKFIYAEQENETPPETNKIPPAPQDPFSNAEVFDERYCANYKPLMGALENDSGIIAIKSNMGTGKTIAYSRVLKNVTGNVGVVTFRISLANKSKQDFPGFACYNECEGKIKDARWICQLDSLHRIPANTVLESLFIDEVSQTRRHLTSDTYLKQKTCVKNRQNFYSMIKDARQVVLCDANLTQTDLKWILKIRDTEKNIKIFHNKNVPRECSILMMKNQHRVIKMAKLDLAKGRKIVIAHNGGKKHHMPIRKMLGLDKKVLVINSEQAHLPEVADALKYPNREWQKYDCIIYSPTVQSGVSVDIPNVFHRVYGIFTNCTNSSGDVCQMMQRTRHPISNVYVVSVEMYHTVQTRTLQTIRERVRDTRAHLVLDDTETTCGPFNNYSEIEFAGSPLNNDICNAQLEQNIDRVNFKANFMRWQLSYGNKIIFEIEEDKKKTLASDTKSRLDKKRLLSEELDEKAEELCNAPTIDQEEVNNIRERLEKNEKVGVNELLSLKKFNESNFYSLDTQPEAPQWYRVYCQNKIKNHYRNSGKYYTDKTLETTLEEVRIAEINRDRNARTGQDSIPSLDECVRSFHINKPRYAKEKVLVGWLRRLGFEKLNSDGKIKAANIQLKLVQIIDELTSKDFNVLEKHKKTIHSIKNLDGKFFIREGLKFINGSLKDYWGVCVVKENRTSDNYILKNEHIENKIFSTEVNDSNTPVLGKTRVYTHDNEVEEESDGGEFVDDMLLQLQLKKTCEKLVKK